MHRHVLSTALLVAGAVGAPAAGQCLGPDNLTGPCWVPTQANIPDFPDLTFGGTDICWTDCDPLQGNTRMILQSPQRLSCDRFSSRLDVFDSTTGALTLSGAVELDYTRTWEEISPLPNQRRYQVFRFVAKVDMRLLTTATPSPCLVPDCFSAHSSAFYYGYVDYAFDCLDATFHPAVVLFHNCDLFIHQQGLSSRPGSFHPNRSYALVGPSSAANPFVASYRTAPGGPMVAEAIRNAAPAAGAPCITEDPIQQGEIVPLGEGCACKPSFTNLQVTARHIEGVGSCTNAAGNQTTFMSVNVWPKLPWYELMTTSIGNWTTDASYPGKEHAWVDEGAFFLRDACAAALGGPGAFAEIYYGGSTSDGWAVTPTPVVPLTQNFTDIASNRSFRLPGPAVFPFVGNVFPTRNLIYTNVP